MMKFSKNARYRWKMEDRWVIQIGNLLLGDLDDTLVHNIFHDIFFSLFCFSSSSLSL